MDEYMDWYVFNSPSKTFTYFEDWAGFNVPGNAVIDFFNTFTNVEHQLRRKEIEILSHVIDRITNDDSDFCIIGTYAGNSNSLEHELRHAYYYMHPEYRAACDEIYNAMPPSLIAQVRQHLLEWGYVDDVIPDEIQAYFGSDTAENLASTFDLDCVPTEWVDKFSQVSYEQ